MGLLAEGNSLRAASRLADVSINTVTKLLLDVGVACEEYQDRTLRNLKLVPLDDAGLALAAALVVWDGRLILDVDS